MRPSGGSMFSRVAVTGGIGAGKSTITKHLQQRGAFVIDYDEVSREIVAPGTDGLRRVVDLFGSEALNADGTMNRKWVSHEVFGRPDLRKRYESIIHPLIFADAEKQESDWIASLEGRCELSQGNGRSGHYCKPGSPHRIVIHEIPLLAETGIARWFDTVIDIEAPEEVRIQRLVESRNLNRAEARARIASQASEEQRRQIATYVINSDKPLQEVYDEVDRIYDKLCHLEG